MKTPYVPILAALALLAGAARAEGRKSIAVTLTNTLPIARPSATVVLAVKDLKKIDAAFDPANFLATLPGEGSGVAAGRLARQIPAQADDLDGDGTADEIALEVSLPPDTSRVVTLEYGKDARITDRRVSFPKRAHASYQQKYEGMGWESDRVGWRMYFDERNAFDMWGKKQHAMLLDYFALPGVDYHSESPLGRDTYKIGDALGIGSVGAYVDGKALKVGKVDSRTWKVLADGPVRAIADLIYKGWDVNGRKVDLTSRLTVWAGHHWFDHHIAVTGGDGITMVTGLPVKPADEVRFSTLAVPRDHANAYALVTWGRQVLKPGATSTESLPDHNMGLAVIIPQKNGPVARDLTDAANHLAGVPLKREDGAATAWWRVVSAWDEESPDGDSVAGLSPAAQLPRAVQTQQAWTDYVGNLALEAADPVTVTLSARTTATPAF